MLAAKRRPRPTLHRREWFESTVEILEFGQWLEERGELPPLPPEWERLFEKPWCWAVEHNEYVRRDLP